MSFEFSEWTVQQASSHDLQVVIIYRLQSDSDDRRIPMNIFFTEFSDYLILKPQFYARNSWCLLPLLIFMWMYHMTASVQNYQIFRSLSVYNSMWWAPPTFMDTPQSCSSSESLIRFFDLHLKLIAISLITHQCFVSFILSCVPSLPGPQEEK